MRVSKKNKTKKKKKKKKNPNPPQTKNKVVWGGGWGRRGAGFFRGGRGVVGGGGCSFWGVVGLGGWGGGVGTFSCGGVWILFGGGVSFFFFLKLFAKSPRYFPFPPNGPPFFDEFTPSIFLRCLFDSLSGLRRLLFTFFFLSMGPHRI